jgi:hypothetical protein
MLSRLVVPSARVFASIIRKCLAFLGLDAKFAGSSGSLSVWALTSGSASLSATSLSPPKFI